MVLILRYKSRNKMLGHHLIKVQYQQGGTLVVHNFTYNQGDKTILIRFMDENHCEAGFFIRKEGERSEQCD